MTISLPPDIKALMTTSIVWEASGALDGYGQWTYGSPVTLTCWTEPHSGGQNFGVTAIRKPDGTVVEPILDVYLDGDDTNARLVKLWDRFTPTGIATEHAKLQAVHVETMYGPPFDNINPWLIIVML
jgi:hypothetical protein